MEQTEEQCDKNGFIVLKETTHNTNNKPKGNYIMENYCVIITETMMKAFEVEAESPEDALDTVVAKHEAGEEGYTFTDEDLYDSEVGVYKVD